MHPLTDNVEILRGVAIFGIVATQIMNLSSLQSIIEIVRAKSTLLYPTFPFSVSIVASGTSIVYSILSDQLVVGLSSIMTVAQCLVYLSIHIFYSTTRFRIFREFVILLIIVVLSLAVGPLFGCFFSTMPCSTFATEWFGLVMAIVSCVRYSAQSVTFYQVVHTKCSASISPAMTMGALFGSLAWTVYSILAGDPYYLASGLCGTVSCLIQIFFLIKYPHVLVVPKEQPIELEASPPLHTQERISSFGIE